MMYSEAEKHSNMIIEAVMLSPASQQYLSPGRVVIVKSQLVSPQYYYIYLKICMWMSSQIAMLVDVGNAKPLIIIEEQEY